MSLVTGREAAQHLGISVRQAQRLVQTGQLDAVGLDRIDYESVARLASQRQGHHHRAWTEPTAWGAVALLSGSDPVWMGQPQRSRLKKTLRELDTSELVGRTRNRAVPLYYRSHPAAVDRLRPHLVITAARGELGELTASTTGLDGYVSTDQVASLVSRHRLVKDWGGNVILRATTMDRHLVESLASSPVLAALDLATSEDERERAAGLEGLESALEVFRG